MGRLSTLKPRIATVGNRLMGVSQDRQATRELATNSPAWRALRQEVMVRDLFRCQQCGGSCAGKGQAHVDHINGDSRDNRKENLQTLCPSCHSIKTAKHDAGFGNARK